MKLIHPRSALICWLFPCLLSCQKPSLTDAPRSEIDSLFHAIDSTRIAGTFTQNDFQHLNNQLKNYIPLRKSELLKKYDLSHWYYTEFLNMQHEKANAVSDSALRLFMGDTWHPADSSAYQKWLLTKGDDLVNLKRFNEAFRYYYRVMKTLSGNPECCRSYRIATRLGNVRFKQCHYIDAIQYYKQAFYLNLACRKNNGITDYYQTVTEPQSKLNGIGLFFEHDGQLDSALHYYRYALDFLEEAAAAFPGHEKDKQVALGVIYGNLGGALTKLGCHTEAEPLLRQSIAINDRPAFDRRDALTAKLKLIRLLIETNRLPEATQLQLEIEHLSDSLPSDEITAGLKRARWLLEKKRGDHASAYQALEAYQLFKDSLLKTQYNILNADFVAEFENMEQAQALMKLADKNRQNYISFLITFSILSMSLAIAFLVYKNWQRSQLHVRSLKRLNERVQERNEKLQLTLQALQTSQQENTRIMAMVAHDLKGPIGSIKIGTDFLLARELHTPEKTVKMLETINRAAGKALLLIEELVQSNAQDTTENKSFLNIQTMILDCAALMKLRADEKQQTLHLSLIPVHFFCNGEKLWRIISNLVINAIKFTPLNGRIDIRLQQIGRNMVIEVIDNGIGIPEHLLEGLFEFGTSAGRPGTVGEPSTGMGLAIVKQIVASYRGRIEVESREGLGTSFRVLLPL